MAGVEELTLADDDGPGGVVRVEGLDRFEFDVLLEKHPARDGEQMPWNDVTFPPELLARCCGWTLQDAVNFWNDTPVDEAEDVFEVAVRLSAPGSWAWATRRLLQDPRLRMELRLCNQAGIDIEDFHRRSERSQDLALASYVLDLDRCPGCGVPSAGMTEEDAASVQVLSCVHCDARAAVQQDIPDEARDRVHVVVVPVGG